MPQYSIVCQKTIRLISICLIMEAYITWIVSLVQLPVEFGIRGNRSCSCRIPPTTGIQITSYINKNMYSAWNPQSKAWHPESNSTLDSLKRGKGIAHHTNKINFAKRKWKKKKQTNWSDKRLTSGAQWFLHLNPFPDINNHYHKLLISCRADK